MKIPKIPKNEAQRLSALEACDLLDTLPEPYFDSIVQMASAICETPISLISLVDKNRQWFKAKVGLNASETSRDVSFCGHAINGDDLFYIEDATKDERFFDNPLVLSTPDVIFYAGFPIKSNNGFNLGTLCVIDNRPRSLNQNQIDQLAILAKQVGHFLNLRNEVNKKYKQAILIDKLSLNLPGFIYTYKLNPDGTSCFPYCSKFIEQIYEVSPEDVVDNAELVFKRLHPEDFDNIVKSIQLSAENMSTWSLDYRVVLPKAGVKWVRGNANPEKLKDGSILWHGYISDITEIKQNEQVLYDNQKLATLGEMAASIAHEINNPLSIIKTSASQLKKLIDRESYDQIKIANYAKKIDETSERIAKIIRGLSFFSKRNNEEFKAESIIDIIHDTFSICSEKFKLAQIKFEIVLPSNFSDNYIDCKSVEISQVLLNLLNNSYDAICEREDRWVKIEIEDSNDSIIISVIDSGDGIPEQIKDKILNPFYTTKTAGKGTGLGLSISQRIIESHSGKFWINSHCLNTKFSFKLKKSVLKKQLSA